MTDNDCFDILLSRFMGFQLDTCAFLDVAGGSNYENLSKCYKINEEQKWCPILRAKQLFRTLCSNTPQS